MLEGVLNTAEAEDMTALCQSGAYKFLQTDRTVKVLRNELVKVLECDFLISQRRIFMIKCVLV